MFDRLVRDLFQVGRQKNRNETDELLCRSLSGKKSTHLLTYQWLLMTRWSSCSVVLCYDLQWRPTEQECFHRLWALYKGPDTSLWIPFAIVQKVAKLALGCRLSRNNQKTKHILMSLPTRLTKYWASLLIPILRHSNINAKKASQLKRTYKYIKQKRLKTLVCKGVININKWAFKDDRWQSKKNVK